MDNTIILCNNTLNFSFKQNLSSINDLLYNIQNLKQLQNNINQIVDLKDKLQMQTNMVSLALLRCYILDEGYVGITLFRNLIRSFYPLNDEQILKYENVLEYHQYNITNINVLKRKGPGFTCNKQRYYRLRPYRNATTLEIPHYNIMREISSRKELEMFIAKEERTAKTGALYFWDMFYALNRHIDLSNDNILSGIDRNKEIIFLIQNEGIIWNWEIIKKIKESFKEVEWWHLIENEGFIAQMGINNIEDTIKHLQTIIGIEFTTDERMEILTRYKNIGIKLYSYLPSLSKAFIVEHQNELDWNILITNPNIQWDLELVNLLLKKCQTNISETDWDNYLNNPSYVIYQAIEPYLNDELLNDIEKLYEL